ncbi:hypothetical protein [Brenneria alni]|uniref:hypothetical protein n=1 Tax=Brenneria alni TaxID=71656 RepID=UPI0011C49C69|nr:hypothetical protein [Brenneria alni]
MALNSIDLDVMERLARKQADLRLSRYLCDTLAPLLPRPTAPATLSGPPCVISIELWPFLLLQPVIYRIA